MNRLLREPLLHFLILGAGLFLLFGWISGPGEAPPDRIVVSSGKVAQLTEAFARTWKRPPSRQELEGLIQEHIREEVYYREARALGLDEDDTIVRRRLRQKLEFFADDLVEDVMPEEAQLAAFKAEHEEVFRRPGRISFVQVYVNPASRGERAMADAERILRELQQDADSKAAERGDRLMVQTRQEKVSEAAVISRFGLPFAERLRALPLEVWSGPVESGYGLHLVKVVERQPGEIPSLEEVRAEVLREWQHRRRQETTEAFYARLLERYVIEVEGLDGEAAEAASAVPVGALQ